MPRDQTAAGGVRPGLEVLLTDSLHLVGQRRAGLVTNQAGVDRAGVSGVDRLLAAGVSLVALFSPEHGFRGAADPGAAVASTRDSATGLPIYSLYGVTSAPTDSMLAGIEVMLIDLQDAGARYYSYLWTVVGVMQSAARRGIPVIVLDRPNPIGGQVQGNVLDTGYRSPVGLLAVSMRHGMTLGELALLARHDLGLATRLTIIPAAGWRRSMYFDATRLPFIPPSPNLRTLDALIDYPGLCLFEGTSLSVGRGTDHPFEQVGAPWLDTVSVLARLRRQSLPGVAFEGVSFVPRRPGDGKFADTLVYGIRLRVTDRSVYDPALTAIAMLAAFQGGRVPIGLGPPLFPVDRRHFARLYGQSTETLASAMNSFEHDPRAAILELGSRWKKEQARFLARRHPYLLYPDN